VHLEHDLLEHSRPPEQRFERNDALAAPEPLIGRGDAAPFMLGIET
jgi:hypothetical protein